MRTLFLLLLVGLSLFIYSKIINNYPILLMNTECTIIKETTEGARARIKELEDEGKTIYEIVDILEYEGYIKESEK